MTEQGSNCLWIRDACPQGSLKSGFCFLIKAFAMRDVLSGEMKNTQFLYTRFSG